MARYIDADAFRQKLIDRQITTQFFNPRERHEIGCIIEMLDNSPTADVVPKSEVDVEHHRVTGGNFTFEYGIVVYKHRFSINRSLDDYEETTLNKCIRMGVQYKYKTMACDKLIAEMQITYKDENDKLHCLCKDLHDFTFEIKHKGDMKISL